MYIVFGVKKNRKESLLPFLATTSASIIGQPSSLSWEDTVLFPEAIPPVSPTRNMLKENNRHALIKVQSYKLQIVSSLLTQGSQCIRAAGGLVVRELSLKRCGFWCCPPQLHKVRSSNPSIASGITDVPLINIPIYPCWAPTASWVKCRRVK